MGFKKSLNIGNIGQQYFIDIMESVGFKCKSIDGKFGDYDVEISGHNMNFTAEVKYDKMSAKTGNIALEYHNSSTNKPSGINSTKADLWIHVLSKDKILIAKSEDIKFLRHSSLHKPLRIVKNAGDGNADLILYKIETLMSVFVVLNEQKDIPKFIRDLLNVKQK